MAIVLNYLAILAGAASAMILGTIWYHSKVFGTAWLKLIGKKQSDFKNMQKSAGPAYAIMSLSSLAMAFAVSIAVDVSGAKTFSDAIATGGLIWLGFVATTMSANYAFTQKPLKLYFIDSFYHLATILAMTIIATVWA